MAELLDACARLHRHLCPRQVLGVRIGICAGTALGLSLPQADKRLYAIVEIDGCASDGVAVATGCSVGRRTLRIEDVGKVAATFVDTWSGRTIRLVPRSTVRALAGAYAPDATNNWTAQLLAYQRMPDEELLELQQVELLASIQTLIGPPGPKAICCRCGEEILHGREMQLEGLTLCRSCAGIGYYKIVGRPDGATPRDILSPTQYDASAPP